MKALLPDPVAITMWDFSWLERRWPGAGYEDFDVALSELAERGYDAVRIDAYPHLVAEDPDRTWELLPNWDQQDWGARSLCWVAPMPALLEFVQAARRHGVRVGLSSWFREDRDNTRMLIRDPRDLAQVWLRTLEHLDRTGLLDTILYVDLCNEFCMPPCAPWIYSDRLLQRLVRRREPVDVTLRTLLEPQLSRTDPYVVSWMSESIGLLREHYPGLPYTFSVCDELPTWREQDVSMLDVMEPHIWMSSNEYSNFDQLVGYDYEAFSPQGYENLVANARRTYEAESDRFDAALFRSIDEVADWSRATGLPLYTTECWAVTDWKDWPGLQWDWVMDVNAKGVEHAAATGRWAGIATSNHCGPQFVGMWREVEWHQRLTTLIKSSPMDADIGP